MSENLRDWVAEEEERAVASRSRRPKYKSSFDPKAAPSYSTFTKNAPTEVPKELKPERRPTVPRRHEKPQHGMASTKNFIVANAVQVILNGKRLADKPRSGNQKIERYVDKKDYGKRPAYLNKVKEQMELETELLREYFEDAKLSEMGGQAVESMADADREALIKDLKRKWGAINKSYQRTCGGAESLSKNKLKERFEKEMQLIENDIKLLQRGKIKILLDE